MKYCAKCQKNKPLSEFAFKNKQKGWLVSYCKECNREYQRNHYKNNKSCYHLKRKEWRTKFRIEIREKVIEYLGTHPCVDCGEKDFAVLEFDHVRGDKKGNIANLIANDTSWHAIKEEINKCDIRCANCHKRRSAKQFGWYKYME